MTHKLRILFVEDLTSDQELAERQLRTNDFNFESLRVDTGDDFLNALATFQPDLIISDYSMPGFDGMQALQMAKELYPELPFVVLTGSMNEDTAVDCMKAGAADYVIKEHINRLPFAVRDALKQAADRKEKEIAKNKLQASESKFRSLFQNNHAIMMLIDPSTGGIIDVNPAACKYYGYSQQKLTNKKITEINTLSPEAVQKEMQRALAEERNYFNFQHRLANGDIRDVEVYSGPIQHMGRELLYSIIHDVTEKKQAEQQIRLQATALNAADNAIVITDREGNIQWVNPAYSRLTGYSFEEVIGQNPRILKSGMQDQAYYQQLWNTILSGKVWEGELINKRKDGSLYTEDETITPMLDEQGNISHFIAIKEDITQRKQAEQALREGEQRYRNLYEESPVSIWEEDFSKVKQRLDQLKSEGIEDFYEYFVTNHTELLQIAELIVVIDVNQETIKLFGAHNKEELRDNFSNIYTEQSLDQLIEELVYIANGVTNFDIDFTNRTVDGRVLEFSAKWAAMPGYEEDLSKVLISMVDITDRKKAEAALRENEQRYRSLFDDSPVAIFEEDFSDVKTRLIELKRSGVEDFHEFLNTHPDELANLIHLIKIIDINKEAERIYGFQSREEFNGHIEPIASPFNQSLMIDELVKVADGFTKFQTEVYKTDSLGKLSYLSVNWAAVPGCEEDLSKVIVTVVDITERKELEKSQQERLAEMEAIDKITTALREARSKEEALPIFLQETLAMMHMKMGSIWLYQKGSDTLQVSSAIGCEDDLSTMEIKPGQGIVGNVFLKGKSFYSTDFGNEAEFPPCSEEHIKEGIGGICVPIQSQEEELGVILILYPKEKEVKSDEVRLLESFARIAGITLQRITLYEDTLIHLKQLQVQRTIDQTIASVFDLNLIMEIICSQTRNYLKADAIGILLLESTQLELNYMASSGFHSRYYKNCRLQLGAGPAGKSALSREIIHVKDLKQSNPPFKTMVLVEEEKFISYLAVPLVAKGELKGVMEIFYRTDTDFDSSLNEFLESLAFQTAIAIDNLQLFENLQQSNQELVQAYDATIEGWSRAMDLRDKETEDHTRRVTNTALRISRRMGVKEEEMVHIRRGALLHDIGKMGVPDEILHKPGPLTPEEWVIMKQHPVFAYEMIAPIDYLKPALDIPYCHHEKWDGSGYPRGLKGEGIPLAGRIFAVIDVWDALSSDRPYRKAWPKEKVLGYIKEQSGTHFDPEIVKVFLEVVESEDWYDE